MAASGLLTTNLGHVNVGLLSFSFAAEMLNGNSIEYLRPLAEQASRFVAQMQRAYTDRWTKSVDDVGDISKTGAFYPEIPK